MIQTFHNEDKGTNQYAIELSDLRKLSSNKYDPEQLHLTLNDLPNLHFELKDIVLRR